MAQEFETFLTEFKEKPWIHVPEDYIARYQENVTSKSFIGICTTQFKMYGWYASQYPIQKTMKIFCDSYCSFTKKFK